MFLMRAFLNPDSTAVRADLASPERLHKTVMRAFSGLEGPHARKEHAILHRVERDPSGRLVLLVQSRTRPDPTRWRPDYVAPSSDLDLGFAALDNPALREIGASWQAIHAGRRLLFRLKANTTKRLLGERIDGKRPAGKRVPLRGDEARRAWLGRHAERCGFRCNVDDVRVSELSAAGGNGGKRVTLAGAVFDGLLEVVDANQFRAALEHGIGPAKAYGFGLLSIAVPR